MATAKNFEDYDSIQDLLEATASLSAANVVVEPKAFPNWTAVTASKVLHHRRPHIVLVIDLWVPEF